MMPPPKPLPYSDEFGSVDEYLDALLSFASTSDPFRLLSGGVHILDFFTSDPGLFHTVFPPEWRQFLTGCDPVRLLDLLMRDDLASAPPEAPRSLIDFVRDVRRLSLDRSFAPAARPAPKLPVLPRHVALGMGAKKVHEVTNFAGYVDRLVDDVAAGGTAGAGAGPITHVVDFGSGQNYLGRALASEPYRRRVVALESREANIAGARRFDVHARMAEKAVVKRNKKLWMQIQVDRMGPDRVSDKLRRKRARDGQLAADETVDLRPLRELEITYPVMSPTEGATETEAGGGGGVAIQYIEGRLESGDLSAVVAHVRASGTAQPRLLAVSIHSCGNLSHHAIRSLILNPAVGAVAVVGCCYNLATERLGPPADADDVAPLPYLRPSLQPLNGRVVRESERRDPEGFPMSRRLCEHAGRGVRLNITARMMACQAPHNWTARESDTFFTRHFYRAVLQRIFLDRAVVAPVHHGPAKDGRPGAAADGAAGPFNTSTNPVILGSLPKPCYRSLAAYVRGAIAKLVTSDVFAEHAAAVRERMADMTDLDMSRYEATFGPRKVELSAAWSLMAFAAQISEALIVADRWLFLREHADTVDRCWVEAVFDYGQSPRNLVVVGIKR